MEISVTEDDLLRCFLAKYGSLDSMDRSPRMRLNFGYFTPDDWYETLVEKLVTNRTKWLDVGCGRNVFPSNPNLSNELSQRCQLLVGIDPDETIHENPFVHKKIQCAIDNENVLSLLANTKPFDLITLRMVAEHLTHPRKVVENLRYICGPASRVVIYTIYRWSPVPIITKLTPFFLHHPVKKVLWGTSRKDTFPVAYKMNDRKTLKQLFEQHGFRESYFMYLNDCRTFSRFNALRYAELWINKRLNALGLHYPELCLLGVYQTR